MDLLNVLAEVAKATGVEVPESDYGAITTINDFADYLSAHAST
jgi:acyl carrier protein